MRRKIVALSIIVLVLIATGIIVLGYAESTWNETEYSGHVVSFYVQEIAPVWTLASIFPGNSTYYGMTVILDNGTLIHVELNGRCVIHGFGINSSVFLGYNTGLWNPSAHWVLVAPLTDYCQIG